jgi:hypothetical protein
VRKEVLERDWILLLDMIQPHADYWQNLSENAAAKLEKNQEAQRILKKELTEHRDKHARAVQARINGEISQEDFEIWKSSAATDVARLETILNDLQAAEEGVQTAKEAKTLSSVSFSTAWTNAETLDQKQAFQSSLFPIGIFWSKQNAFFEPENRSLMSLVSEMIDTMDGPTAVPELSGRDDWIWNIPRVSDSVSYSFYVPANPSKPIQPPNQGTWRVHGTRSGNSFGLCKLRFSFLLGQTEAGVAHEAHSGTGPLRGRPRQRLSGYFRCRRTEVRNARAVFRSAGHTIEILARGQHHGAHSRQTPRDFVYLR